MLILILSMNLAMGLGRPQVLANPHGSLFHRLGLACAGDLIGHGQVFFWSSCGDIVCIQSLGMSWIFADEYIYIYMCVCII